jgi:putative ABC transport system permease protein
MTRIQWRKIIRELWSNKARTLLVVLSIAVGVFAIGTIANSWIVMLNDLSTQYLATDPADAVFDLQPFGDDVVSAVEGMRGVDTAEGRASVVVKLDTSDGEQVNLNLYAVEDFRQLELSRMTPETGQWPPLRRQLFVERSWAPRLAGVDIGDNVIVEAPDGRQYELVFGGLAHDLHQPSAFVSDTAYGYVNLDTLEWLGQQRAFDRLYITVTGNRLDKDHITAVTQDVKDRLERDGIAVRSVTIPTPGEHFATPFVKAFLLVLGFLGVFSMFLSGALVLNTVSAVVARQVKQIGVMKALGGSNVQIAEIYIGLVVVFGLLSLLIAVPLALLGTRGLSNFYAGAVNFDVITTSIPPVVILLEVFVGLAVPVAAALVPILSGLRITVREAISDYGLGSDDPNSLAMRLTSGRGFNGALALAFRNTFRRKTRLALTLITLTLAGATFVSVLSVRRALYTSFDEVLGYYQYDILTDFSDTYRFTQIEREARRQPEVSAVEGWLSVGAVRQRPDATESGSYRLVGVPPDSDFIDPILTAGRWLRPDDRNAVVVNVDVLINDPDIQVGDWITLTVDGDDTLWQVVGTITSQYEPAGTIYTTNEALGRQIDRIGYANQVVIRLTDSRPNVQKRIAPLVEERFKNAGMLVGRTTAISDFVSSFEARFNLLTVFMLLMAFLLAIVGGFGLAGMMGLNVLERIREIGVIRAIGASDGQVRRIILAEGVVVGLISWALAFALSFPLSKLLSDGVGLAFANEPLPFSFSYWGGAIWLGFALLIAIIASYIPARSASRLSVRETLVYE